MVFHLLDKEIKRKGSTGRTSKLNWPIQPSPGKEARREWEKALATIPKQQTKLEELLAQWFTDLDSEWKFGYQISTPHRLIQKTWQTFTSHTLECGSYRKIYDTKGEPNRTTTHRIPVPAKMKGPGIYVRGELGKETQRRKRQRQTFETSKWKAYFLANTE